MSADKRTVSTDALETLGTIHTRDEKRDAIHLAVIPAMAGSFLPPGTHVALSEGGIADGRVAASRTAESNRCASWQSVGVSYE